MKTALLVASALLAVSNFAYSIDVDVKNRVGNPPPGYCMWAVLETIGRHHNIKPLIGMVEHRQNDLDPILTYGGKYYTIPRNIGGDGLVTTRLVQLDIPYRLQSEGLFDRTLLKMADARGCMITICKNKNDRAAIRHAVLATSYDGKTLKYIDSNKPSVLNVVNEDWLKINWTGFSLIVEQPPNQPEVVK